MKRSSVPWAAVKRLSGGHCSLQSCITPGDGTDFNHGWRPAGAEGFAAGWAF